MTSRLTVLAIEPPAKHRYALVLCTCGGQKRIRLDHVRSGRIRSCGCMPHTPTPEGMERRKQLLRIKSTTHGGRRTRLYNIWCGVKARTGNPNNPAYRWYGAKGIVVDPTWRDFAAFRDWALANGYAPDLTLDRIDSAGDYGPNNCRWITRTLNSSFARRGALARQAGR